MTLDEICQEQFCKSFKLPSLGASVAGTDRGVDASSEFDQSVHRYKQFREESRSRLGALDSAGGVEFLYGALPALLQSGLSSCKLPGAERMDEVREAVTEFLSGYEEAYQPFSLHDIAFKVLERGLFRSVPMVQPSLDLGVGNGYVSNYIFRGQMPTVGSDPLMAPFQFHQEYRRYAHSLCIDATQIPFERDTFATVYMVHSIDHVRDRGAVLAEMHRVLRPGGTVAFSDLSEFAPELMPMGTLCKAMGLDELSSDPSRFFMDMAGESREFWSIDRYRKALAAAGFEDARIQYFCSPRLARFCWAWFEIHLAMNQMDAHLTALRSGRYRHLRESFFDFVTSSLTPFLARDAELCGAVQRGFNFFITARKQGASSPAVPHAPGNGAGDTFDFSGRLVCPACKGKAVIGQESVRCDRCGMQYPVIGSVPLMLPAYAIAYGRIRDELARHRWRRYLPAIRMCVLRRPWLCRVFNTFRQMFAR